MKNLRIPSISVEAFEQVTTKLQEIRDLLPALISLSPVERRHMQKNARLGPGLGKAISQSSKIHIQAVPREFEVESFDNEITYHDFLQILEKELLSTTQSVSDTRIVINQSVMQQCSDVYAALKRAAKRELKYQAAVTELSSFYKRGKVKKNSVKPDNTTTNE